MIYHYFLLFLPIIFLFTSSDLLGSYLTHSGRHKYFHNNRLMTLWPGGPGHFSLVQFSLNDIIYIESISN